MIQSASYVTCDRCGDPAEIAVEGGGMARRYAKEAGFVRIQFTPDAERADFLEGFARGEEDVCKRCQTPEEEDA